MGFMGRSACGGLRRDFRLPSGSVRTRMASRRRTNRVQHRVPDYVHAILFQPSDLHHPGIRRRHSRYSLGRDRGHRRGCAGVLVPWAADINRREQDRPKVLIALWHCLDGNKIPDEEPLALGKEVVTPRSHRTA